jgi:hypothetical protein
MFSKCGQGKKYELEPTRALYFVGTVIMKRWSFWKRIASQARGVCMQGDRSIIRLG